MSKAPKVEQALAEELAEFDEKLAAKKEELRSLTTDIKSAKIRRGQAERRLKESAGQFEILERDYSKRKRELEGDYDEQLTKWEREAAIHRQTIANTETESEQARKKLKLVNADVAQRESYLKEQEAIIQTAMDDGAGRLADLDYQVKHVLQQQQEALLDSSNLENGRDELNASIIKLIERREALDNAYAEAVKKYKANLADLRLQTENQRIALEKTTDDSRVMVEKLSAKEHELEGRDQALREIEGEMAEERRFIESRKYLYKQP